MFKMGKIIKIVLIAATIFAESVTAATPKIASSSSPTNFTIAVNSDGQVLTWGNNQHGQLGDGTTNSKLRPQLVPGLTNVIDVAAGESHALALKSDGTVWAWGGNYCSPFYALVYNLCGQRGDSGAFDRLNPVQIVGLSNIVAVAAVRDSSYAVRSDGQVFAWGGNDSGQLGDGTLTNHTTPSLIVGLQNITAISTNLSFSKVGNGVVALKSDGTVWVWGRSGDFCGTATCSYIQTTPVQVPGFTGATAIAYGRNHVVAIKSDGSVWGWGDNIIGGSVTGVIRSPSYVYTPIQVFTGAKAIEANDGGESFAVMMDGTVRAWGGAYAIRASIGGPQTHFVQINGLKYIDSIRASAYFQHFVITDYGLVKGWGFNYDGQVGDGTQIQRGNPVRLAGINGLSALYLIPPPSLPNDQFANRVTLSGSAGTTTVINELATKEPSEPNHAGDPGGKSVWWTWTAPSAGQVILTTDSDFTTLIAAYTGTNVSALNAVGSSNSGQVVFQASAGVPYQIALDGVNGASGKVILQRTFNPLAKADISISGPPPGSNFNVGEGFSYPITVTNNGPQAASNVRVTVNLPPNTTFVSGPGCTGTTTVVCSIGTIAVGQTINIPIIINITAAGNIAVTATVSTDTPEQTTNNNFVASNNTAVVAPLENADVPTLPEWGMILMGMLLLASMYRSQRNGGKLPNL